MAMSSLPSIATLKRLAVQMRVTLVSFLLKTANLLIAAFAPISQIRFWGAQVICVATPSAFFVVYSIERKPTGKSVYFVIIPNLAV